MKVSKPLHISCIHKTLSFGGKHFFSVATILPFSLQNGDIKMEPEFWQSIGTVLKEGFFDSGVAKESAEFIVAGNFYSPNQQPVKAGWVSARVGSVEKKLAVTGDRYWLSEGEITDPVEFTSMPVTYQHAFGGPTNTANRQGKGDYSKSDSEPELRPLPNIEYIDQLITSEKSNPTPAALNQIDVLTEARRKKMGTYDENSVPYELAPDIDWHFFNDAAQDQWFPEPLTGEETFEFQFMHPEHAMLTGTLPSMRMRAFVHRQGKDSESATEIKPEGQTPVYEIEEIQLKLDTLWFAPHKNLGALVCHGSCEVSDRLANEIDHLLLAFEDLTQTPRSHADYAVSMQMREDPQQAMTYALLSVDLTAESYETDMEDLLFKNDPDRIENFTTDNINVFVDNSTKDIDNEISAAIDTIESGQQEQIESVRANFKKIGDEINSIDENIKALSAMPASDATAQQLRQLQDLRATHLNSEEKLNDLTKQIEGIFPEVRDAIKNRNNIDDPELLALMTFVETYIAPKSKRYPELVDPTKVDFRALEQLPEKINAYVKQKLESQIPLVEERFKEIEAQLKSARASLEDGIAATQNELDKAAENFDGFGDSVKTSASVQNTKVDVEQARKDAVLLKADVQSNLDELEKQSSDLKELSLKLLSGERIARPLFRPPGPEILEKLETEVAEQLDGFKSHIDEAEKQAKAAFDNEMIKNAVGTSDSYGVPTQAKETLKQSLESAKNNVVDMDQYRLFIKEIEEQALNLEEQKQVLLDRKPQLKESYRIGAHAFEEGLTPHADSHKAVYDNFVENYGRVSDDHEWDIACLDLTGLELNDTQIRDSYAEQVNFSLVKFSDVSMTKLIMPRANICQAFFQNCDFSNSNIGTSEIHDTNFVDCQFSETIFSDTKFHRCTFRGCVFSANPFLGAELEEVTFIACKIDGANLIDLKLHKLNFQDCDISNSAFLQGDSKLINIVASRLDKVAFIDQALASCDFRGSQIKNVAYMGKTDLQGADFSEATLENVSFKDLKLNGASFERATMASVLLSGADLTSVNMNYVHAPQIQIAEATLLNAKLQDANLMECRFDSSNLLGTDFSRANLFSASFIDATLGSTNFFEANLERTALQDWQPD